MWAYTFADALALFPFFLTALGQADFDEIWMDLPLQGTLASHDTDSPSLLRCLTFRTGYRLNHIQTIGSTSGWLECGAHGSMRVDGLDRHMCGQDPWWQATNASDLGTVNRLKLCCGYFHLNRSTNHQIISNQIALLFAEEHREASLVWLLLAPHSFRLVKVATALSVTKTKRPNSTKKSLALCF